VEGLEEHKKRVESGELKQYIKKYKDFSTASIYCYNKKGNVDGIWSVYHPQGWVAAYFLYDNGKLIGSELTKKGEGHNEKMKVYFKEHEEQLPNKKSWKNDINT
jgi:hypothetical protein